MIINNHGYHHENENHNGNQHNGHDVRGGKSFEEACETLLRYGRRDIIRAEDEEEEEESPRSSVRPRHPAHPTLRPSQMDAPPASAEKRQLPPREPRIRFFMPGELRDYQPSSDILLAGECHIMRGEVFVIGGEPGVGKSRAATALAVAGATCGEWLGLKIHRPFRTMIIQTENGRYRLQQEYGALACDALNPWIRVSEPPPFGITLGNSEFIEDIRRAIDDFRPDCVILDPWNAAAKDDKQRDYSETFDRLRAILPTGSGKPALGIVAHTRKPQPNEKRTGGTGLMHILAGSYMLTSVPRCVFVMTRASEEETDDRIAWFNPKNNNGTLLPRSAWHRGPDGFTRDEAFDWESFEKAAEKAERKMVTIEHLRELFESHDTMELADAVERLAKIAEIAEKSAYAALNEKGKFARHLVRDGKMIRFRE